MKTAARGAPKILPPAVSDLVAEGGNILASDDILGLGADVLEIKQATDDHIATSCGAVVIEQVRQRLQEQFQVALRESRILGQERRNETMCPV